MKYYSFQIAFGIFMLFEYIKEGNSGWWLFFFILFGIVSIISIGGEIGGKKDAD